jgi:methionyl-tRNA formyltransferase
MRLGFYGTPDIAVPYLEALARRHEVVAVVTQPDRPRGRSGAVQPSPVKAAALAVGATVMQPEPGHCRDACSMVESLATDLCVVVAFGQRLPCRTCGCQEGEAINVHYSLLPKLRGAAPVQHAILQGLETTGVTIQYVAPGWDEGDIVLQREVPALPDDTAASLFQRLTEAGVPALLEALELISEGTAQRVPQQHGDATFAPVLRKSDGLIDWCEPAETIARKVRAFNPWPGASTILHNRALKLLSVRVSICDEQREGACGQVVEVAPEAGFAVSCGTGMVWVEEVQPAGKTPMPATDYLRGHRLQVGERLGLSANDS